MQLIQNIVKLRTWFRYFTYHCNSRLYDQASHYRYIANILSNKRRVSSATFSESTKHQEVMYGKCESDSHADTIATGANCVVLNYTGKVCDVSPYRDDYEAVKNVPITNAATA